MLGIGDPELDCETGEVRGVKLASVFTLRGVANVKAVRELTPLPESREELQSLAVPSMQETALFWSAPMLRRQE